MKKLRRAYPIAYDKEKGYTYLTLSKQLITMDKNLDIIGRQPFLNDMYKGILVCDNKILVTASPNGKIASFDLISKKIISRPKNIIGYISDNKLWYCGKKSLIFRIGLGNNKLRMLYSYKMDENGILTVDDETSIDDDMPKDILANYEIFDVKDEEIYMIETSNNKEYNVAFLTYNIKSKEKQYEWKKKLNNNVYGKYDEKHIVDHLGKKIVNVFTKEIMNANIDSYSFYRMLSKDRKYVSGWRSKERKLYIKDAKTYKNLKIIDFELFFSICEMGNYVFVIGDMLYAYTKEEFYSV